MKKILMILLVLLAVLGVAHYEHTYIRKDCVVTQINDGWVTFEDDCGWCWDLEEDGYKVGDVVDLKMHNNYTMRNAYDDIILKVKK